jgi:hypothetical protein
MRPLYIILWLLAFLHALLVAAAALFIRRCRAMFFLAPSLRKA